MLILYCPRFPPLLFHRFRVFICLELSGSGTKKKKKKYIVVESRFKQTSKKVHYISISLYPSLRPILIFTHLFVIC